MPVHLTINSRPMIKYFTIIFFIFFSLFLSKTIFAQDDMAALLDEGTKPEKKYIKNAFKSSRVINSHSMEMIGKGSLDFRILHRFGAINQGIYELFGLDQASMRMGFDYGITKNLTVGVGRSTLNKELDGFIKYRPLWQSETSPISIVLISGMTCKTIRFADPNRTNYFSSRLGYYHQMIIGRKFSENFTMQLVPTVTHRNLVEKADDDNTVGSMGIGGRYKLSKRFAVLADYSYLFNGYPQQFNENPFSIGCDIETGGHVFQLHVSNTRGMNERAFLTETTQNFFKGNIYFGFNLSRMF